MVTHPVRTAVKRAASQKYLLISLVSFAGSVILTRLYLQLTHYPKLGSGQFHIAHVLWGGLLLFIAALLPLILANRWALTTAAVLSGLGVGLFIDEVGKFITMNNDYFFPGAAPIIYAFFLITVFVYMEIRRPPKGSSPRTQMYHVLEEITEVLDSDLDSTERNRMDVKLTAIHDQTTDQNIHALVDALHSYIDNDTLRLADDKPTLARRIQKRVSPYASWIITRRKLKWFLVIALAVLGVMALFQFVLLLAAIPAPGPMVEVFLRPLVNKGALHDAQDALWFLIRTGLEGAVGLLLITAGGLLSTGKERPAANIAILTLVVWLTGINLITFYLDQFGAIAFTLFQFIVLLSLMHYRNHYLKPKGNGG